MKNTKAILVALISLFTNSQSLNAYRYRVANLSSHPIAIDIRAAAKGSFFEGARGAKDSWKIKDYDMIPAKSTKDYSFGGLYCVNTIRVGKSKNDLEPAIIQKAPQDQKEFESTVEKISIIGNTLEEQSGQVKGPIGNALQAVAASLNSIINPIAAVIQDFLCFNMTFYIGPNPHKNVNLRQYVVIAKAGTQNTNKFTGIKANLNNPKTLPNTPFWQRVKDDILPAAKEKASQAYKQL